MNQETLSFIIVPIAANPAFRTATHFFPNTFNPHTESWEQASPWCEKLCCKVSDIVRTTAMNFDHVESTQGCVPLPYPRPSFCMFDHYPKTSYVGSDGNC